MSIAQSSTDTVSPEWEMPTPPTDLEFDDGVPLETARHRIAMNLLIRSVQSALHERTDFFAGGNMFVYYSRNQAMNQDFRGPDVFVALDVDGSRERKSWITWEEDGRYPDVIVELLSASTEKVDRQDKKQLYERVFKTPDYFIFDPFDPNSLQGWRLQLGQGYQPLQPNSQGWLWCETLRLWVGTWEGVIDREPANGTCCWLRFYDSTGHLVLLPEEAAQISVEVAQARADAQQARADAEQARANAEQARADTERIRAEAERIRAEAERIRAEQAEQENARLIERLRSSGVNLDDLLDR